MVDKETIAHRSGTAVQIRFPHRCRQMSEDEATQAIQDAKFIYECWMRAETEKTGEARWHYHDTIRHAVLLLTGSDLRNDYPPGYVNEGLIREVLLTPKHVRALAALLELAEDPPWPEPS